MFFTFDEQQNANGLHARIAGLTRLCDQALVTKLEEVFKTCKRKRDSSDHSSLSFRAFNSQSVTSIDPEKMDVIDFCILASQQDLQRFLAQCVKIICRDSFTAMSVRPLMLQQVSKGNGWLYW